MSDWISKSSNTKFIRQRSCGLISTSFCQISHISSKINLSNGDTEINYSYILKPDLKKLIGEKLMESSAAEINSKSTKSNMIYGKYFLQGC